MSAFNWFLTKKKAYELRTKQLTTASGEITYTARTGRTVDNFVSNAAPKQIPDTKA